MASSLQTVPSFPPTNHPSSCLPEDSVLQFPGSLSEGGSQEPPISHLSRPHPSYLGFTATLLTNYTPLSQVFILPLQTPLSLSFLGSLLSLSHHSNFAVPQVLEIPAANCSSLFFARIIFPELRQVPRSLQCPHPLSPKSLLLTYHIPLMTCPWW